MKTFLPGCGGSLAARWQNTAVLGNCLAGRWRRHHNLDIARRAGVAVASAGPCVFSSLL